MSGVTTLQEAHEGPAPAAAAKPALLYRSSHPGRVNPRRVPCSELGVREHRAKATMGPCSGEEMVSAAKWLRAHEKEPQLPQRETVADAQCAF